MGNLKYKEQEQFSERVEWYHMEKPVILEFLSHIANILAEEYVARMKSAS